MIKQHKNYTISTFTVTSIQYVPKFLTWLIIRFGANGVIRGKLTGNTVQIYQIMNTFAVATSKYIGHGEFITSHSLCAATVSPTPDNCFLDTNLRDIAPNTIRLHVGEDISNAWWRHQMEAFSALLAICAGNSHASNVQLWSILCCYPEEAVKQTFHLPVTWISVTLTWLSL